MEDETLQRKSKRCLATSFFFHMLLFLSFAIARKPLNFTPPIMIDVPDLPSQTKDETKPPPDLSQPIGPIATPSTSNPPNKPEPPKVIKTDHETHDSPAPQPKPKRVKPLAPKRVKNKAEEDAKNALKNLRDYVKHKNEAEQAAHRLLINGNQRNAGVSVTGDLNAAADAYYGHIADKVRSNWSLPSYLQNQGYGAALAVHLDDRGNVIDLKFTKPSGNEVFDNNAESAIRRSSPFLAPPVELAPALKKSGVELKFPM